MSVYKSKLANREAVAIVVLIAICFVESVFAQTPQEKYQQAYDDTIVEEDIVSTTYGFYHNKKRYKIQRIFFQGERGALDSIILYYEPNNNQFTIHDVILADLQVRTIVKGDMATVEIVSKPSTIVVIIDSHKENCGNDCEFWDHFREYDAVTAATAIMGQRKHIIEKEYIRGFLDRIKDIRSSE